jgi:dihydrofolate reductase
MNLTLIAAMSKNRVIGKDNDLIWHLPKDLKHFKTLTSGHHIIMGRKTYESVGKPLPKRTNIIVTRQKNYEAPGCIIVHTLEEAINKASGDSKPFIVGGAEIYKQSIKYANSIELTLIHKEFEGDSYFPEVDLKKWEEVKREHHEPDEKNAQAMDFITYKKR